MNDEQQRPTGTDLAKHTLLANFTRFAMAAGLVSAYGALAAIMGRFLYPSRPSSRGWMFVSNLSGFAPGVSRVFQTPAGETVNITRRGDGKEASDFSALSSVCPHLGCQVHWEPQNDRFFCPCHNGVFSPDGEATSGPPAEAGQSLIEFPLKVERELLFIEVSLVQLTADARGVEEIDRHREYGRPPGPGHDPCLYARRKSKDSKRS